MNDDKLSRLTMLGDARGLNRQAVQLGSDTFVVKDAEHAFLV
jgi:hypothetical protein